MEVVKAVPIRSCSECPFWVTSPYWTEDSFERAEYWWCKCPGNSYEHKEDNHESEKVRQNLISAGEPENIKKIAGYVEWTDKIEIAEWCKLKNFV